MSLAPPVALGGPIDASVDGMRFGLDVDLGCYDVAHEVERAVRESADALAGAGAVVEEVDVGWGREVADAWVAHWGVYLAAIFGDKLEEFRERMDPRVVRLMEAGVGLGAVQFNRLHVVQATALEPLP